MLIVYISIAVLLIAVLLSIPRAPAHNTKPEPSSRKPELTDKREIAVKIAEVNNQAHRKNHRDACRLARQMGYPAASHWANRPLLDDGEVIDAEVTEVAGLLK